MKSQRGKLSFKTSRRKIPAEALARFYRARWIFAAKTMRTTGYNESVDLAMFAFAYSLSTRRNTSKMLPRISRMHSLRFSKLQQIQSLKVSARASCTSRSDKIHLAWARL